MILLVLPEMGSNPAVKAGCPCDGMSETKSSRGVGSIALTETDREDGAEKLLERILDQYLLFIGRRIIYKAALVNGKLPCARCLRTLIV